MDKSLKLYFGVILFSFLTVSIAQKLDLDPVNVAPHIFELLYENDQVRILKVTDRNGDTRPLHSLGNRVVVYLSPCAWMRKTNSGDLIMESFKLGDVAWRNAITDGGRTSNVIQECSSLEIEIKK